MIYSCLNEARLPSWWRSSHKRRRRSQKLLQRAEKSPFLECLHRILRVALSSSMRRHFLTSAATTARFQLNLSRASTISFNPSSGARPSSAPWRCAVSLLCTGARRRLTLRAGEGGEPGLRRGRERRRKSEPRGEGVQRRRAYLQRRSAAAAAIVALRPRSHFHPPPPPALPPPPPPQAAGVVAPGKGKGGAVRRPGRERRRKSEAGGREGVERRRASPQRSAATVSAAAAAFVALRPRSHLHPPLPSALPPSPPAPPGEWAAWRRPRASN